MISNQIQIEWPFIAAIVCLGQETIFEANAHSGKLRVERLELADAHLNKLRLYLRLANQWQWLSNGQYQHISQMITEIGKLLGGWLKQSKGKT